MSSSEEKDAGEEPRRARGRRVGVQQMQKVYIPQLQASFSSLQEILSKRLDAKKTEVRELVCETLGLEEIIRAGAEVARVAREKFEEASRLEEEANELEKQAQAMVNSSKIIELELTENRSYYRSSGMHTKRIKGVEITFTSEFDSLVEAAMMIQKEHLDLEWLRHQKEHYGSQLNRSITMEQAVEVLTEVEELIKNLEREHKELLKKQEEKNARTERVCTEWEEGDPG
ncbi:hypothetical protein LCGC14_0810180 [marine sediment metagenome]|uniref:Uncharacterized protein n=1 Tax=marine sediment metagenome TaxID=412755 RepID=A0A0F9PRH4_9ZZZZ